MVIWIIGRSSSGKTFIGKRLFKILSKKRKCFLVDGDNVRTYLNDDLGYTLKDRKENSLRIQKLCKYLEKNDYLVICCIQSIFKDHQKKNRKFFNNYYQIYLRVENEKIYQKKFKLKKYKKNVVGKDITFPQPFKNDLVVKNNYKNHTRILKDILKGLKSVKKLKR
tara:strand:+ start:9172 stop:9669 length:498 start_codon:yes stop_codon:yes gene_type:complete